MSLPGLAGLVTACARLMVLASGLLALAALIRKDSSSAALLPQTIGGALWLLHFGKRLDVRAASQRALSDPRAPIVYLRSFGVDRLDQVIGGTSTTHEERLVARFNSIGPVLAIGRPGERLGQVGAARLYVSAEAWTSVVQRLMLSARLVVLRAANTSGIRWELSQARELLSAEKVLLWFPMKYKRRGYAAIRDIVRETMRVDLPEAAPQGLVAFDRDWHSKVIAETEALAYFATRKSVPAPASAALHELLNELEARTIYPPPFRLRGLAWLAVGIWFILVVTIASQRGLSVVVEFPIAALIAFVLAVTLYVREPQRVLRPSIVVCSILALHLAWVCYRAASMETTHSASQTTSQRSSKVSREDVLSITTAACQKLTACVTSDQRQAKLSECIEVQMRPFSLVSDTEAGPRAMWQLAALSFTSCGTLTCEEFERCYAYELGLDSLTDEQRSRLIQLGCAAAAEVAESRQQGEKEREFAQALENLRAPSGLPTPYLAEQIFDQMNSSCR